MLLLLLALLLSLRLLRLLRGLPPGPAADVASTAAHITQVVTIDRMIVNVLMLVLDAVTCTPVHTAQLMLCTAVVKEHRLSIRCHTTHDLNQTLDSTTALDYSMK
jgi:hypothetical protein